MGSGFRSAGSWSLPVRQLARRAEHPRLGVPLSDARVTVVEYSQPNIAKEMHVGHLRSTVIGDALD